MARGRSGCQVEGCTVDLASCKPYCQKRRVCDRHLQADCFARKGCRGWWRYCQQCGKLETLDEFEGTRRSCRKSLLRRRENTLPPARRHHERKQPAVAACAPAAAPTIPQPPALPLEQPSSLDASADAAEILADAWCCFSERPHSQEEEQQLAALEQALSGSASASLDALPDGPLRELLLHTWEQPASPSAAADAAAADANSSCADANASTPQALCVAAPAANLLAAFAPGSGSLHQSGSGSGSWGVHAALPQQVMAPAPVAPAAVPLAAVPPAALFEPGVLQPGAAGDPHARLLRIQKSLAHICDELQGLEASVQLAQYSMTSFVLPLALI